MAGQFNECDSSYKYKFTVLNYWLDFECNEKCISFLVIQARLIISINN